MAMTLLARQEQQKPIRAGTQLVVLPTGVTDEHGRPIEGLSSSDFIVLDNGKPRPVQVDTEDSGLAPIALVTLIQTSDISLSALAKIRKVGIMIPDAVVGATGNPPSSPLTARSRFYRTSPRMRTQSPKLSRI
jgi:hypothetical protein